MKFQNDEVAYSDSFFFLFLIKILIIRCLHKYFTKYTVSCKQILCKRHGCSTPTSRQNSEYTDYETMSEADGKGGTTSEAPHKPAKIFTMLGNPPRP